MNILVVTNFYPPHHLGGYELGCRDVVEALRRRGHAVQVLTGNFRHAQTPTSPEETGVERTLQVNVGQNDPRHNKFAEGRKLARAMKIFRPDMVYFWNQAGLCLWLPLAARWHGCRMAFFLSDTNFVSWRIGAWLSGAAKKNSLVRAVFGKSFLVQGWPVIQNRSCHFASEFLRTLAEKNGIRFDAQKSLVTHWGIELKTFAAAPRECPALRKLLYVGQLIPQKGVHTAIAALDLLAREKPEMELSLTIVGGGMHPDYERQLREQAAQTAAAGRIHFAGKVPRADLPGVYAAHDVLIFPSEWDEPFAITPLEAMAGGLAVVGTTTGGSGELFRDRKTAMTFRAGDAADCARAIRELCSDPELFEKISRNGRAEVQKKHSLDRMVDGIEGNLRLET